MSCPEQNADQPFEGHRERWSSWRAGSDWPGCPQDLPVCRSGMESLPFRVLPDGEGGGDVWHDVAA